jgi:hypothetical protein
MTDQHRNPPIPQAQAFVVCQNIWLIPRTGDYVLIGPISHIPIPKFPAEVLVAVYAHVTGGHGHYPMEFVLRAASGEIVWSWKPLDPLMQTNPLVPSQLAFHEVTLQMPAPGRYDLALNVSGQEMCHQPLLIGPAEFFA